jgi:hypothetical protein
MRYRLTPAILATHEEKIRRTIVQSQLGQIVLKTLSRKYPSQKGLAEWLKVKAVSSSPSITKKKMRCSLYSPEMPLKLIVGKHKLMPVSGANDFAGLNS